MPATLPIFRDHDWSPRLPVPSDLGPDPEPTHVRPTPVRLVQPVAELPAPAEPDVAAAA